MPIPTTTAGAAAARVLELIPTARSQVSALREGIPELVGNLDATTREYVDAIGPRRVVQLRVAPDADPARLAAIDDASRALRTSLYKIAQLGNAFGPKDSEHTHAALAALGGVGALPAFTGGVLEASRSTGEFGRFFSNVSEFTGYGRSGENPVSVWGARGARIDGAGTLVDGQVHYDPAHLTSTLQAHLDAVDDLFTRVDTRARAAGAEVSRRP